MAAMITVTIDATDETAATLAARFDRSTKTTSLRELGNFIFALSGGQRRGIVRTAVSGARASKLVNCDESDAVNGTDTITIAGTTLAVVAAPANQSQFLKGASDAAFADNLAACINAHTVLQKLVYAVSDGVANVTIYSVAPGPVGNLIALAETGAGFEIAGGATALSGGTSDEVDTYLCGVVDPAA